MGKSVHKSSGLWITGRNYEPSMCDCDIPPWERCPHSADWAAPELTQADLEPWQQSHLWEIANEA